MTYKLHFSTGMVPPEERPVVITNAVRTPSILCPSMTNSWDRSARLYSSEPLSIKWNVANCTSIFPAKPLLKRCQCLKDLPSIASRPISHSTRKVSHTLRARAELQVSKLSLSFPRRPSNGTTILGACGQHNDVRDRVPWPRHGRFRIR